MNEANTKSLIVEDVTYKFYNKQFSISSSKSIDLKEGVPFVACGIDIGAVLGTVHKIGEYVSNDDTFVRPIVLFCQTVSQASAMFKNIINDKLRFDKLSAEIQKQRVMDGVRKPIFQEVKTQQQAIGETRDSSLENGKRLALNNGIFKSNDNYWY